MTKEAGAVRRKIPATDKAVTLIVDRLKKGGRLIYVTHALGWPSPTAHSSANSSHCLTPSPLEGKNEQIN